MLCQKLLHAHAHAMITLHLILSGPAWSHLVLPGPACSRLVCLVSPGPIWSPHQLGYSQIEIMMKGSQHPLAAARKITTSTCPACFRMVPSGPDWPRSLSPDPAWSLFFFLYICISVSLCLSVSLSLSLFVSSLLGLCLLLLSPMHLPLLLSACVGGAIIMSCVPKVRPGISTPPPSIATLPASQLLPSSQAYSGPPGKHSQEHWCVYPPANTISSPAPLPQLLARSHPWIAWLLSLLLWTPGDFSLCPMRADPSIAGTNHASGGIL